MEQQLELLWQYQQVDMEVERYEREMRQSPNRQKLIKQRDFLMEQQNVVKRIEQEMEYPGQIKVNVIRETRAVEYAK